jgi:hypothetical protein
LGLLVGAKHSLGQAPAEPTLAAGIARLQASDYAGAATILEAVTRREPTNGRAWRNLGLAYQRLTQYDKSIAAWTRSLEVQPAFPTPLYNIATVYAQQQDRDHALEWLARARASRKIDMSQLEVDSNFVFLKSNARFAKLLPGPKDFANPFVEKVQVIREWDGEASNDQFGWIARNIGDVDGDRVPDIVTSAPSRGANAGRVYVYSTKTGHLLWSVDGASGDQLGIGVEGAGDINRDGIPDVIASAPGAGKAMVYSGRDGTVLATYTAEDRGDAFGRHVSGAGDVNRDGYADVMVGAPNNGAAGRRAGRAYLYSGKDGSVLRTLTGEREGDAFGSTVAGFTDASHVLILVGASGAGPRHTGRIYVYDASPATPRFVIESDETGQALGAMFLSVPGDVGGDGVPDVYASDFSNAARGPSTGRVYVHSGKDGHRLLTLTGETAGEGFGIGPASAGDVDGDGSADLIVGSWQYAGEAISGGRAYLYSGKTGRLLATYTCRIPGDTFGFDAVGMGDVDGDGAVDFLITSAWSGIHGYHSGRMFIISSGMKRKR